MKPSSSLRTHFGESGVQLPNCLFNGPNPRAERPMAALAQIQKHRLLQIGPAWHLRVGCDQIDCALGQCEDRVPALGVSLRHRATTATTGGSGGRASATRDDSDDRRR